MKIEDALRTYIINDRFDGQAPTTFDNNFDLIDSGTIDSLFIMDLITYLNQQYQIEFGANDIVPRHFRSVNALSEFVRSQVEEDRRIAQ